MDIASVVACGKAYSMVLSSEGDIWTWGTNSYGQLGLNNTEQYANPQKIDLPNKFTSIHCGMGHSIALDESGKLWAWGWNKFLQLGISEGAFRFMKPQLVNLPSPCSHIVSVSCNLYSSLVLDDKGNLFSLGINETSSVAITLLSSKKKFPKFIKVCCGERHYVGLDVKGQVWSCGKNVSGALGLGTINEIQAPKKVPISKKIVHIESGANHVLSIDEDASVWVWGKNNMGQLGIEHLENIVTPEKVHNIPPIIFAATKTDRSYFIDEGNNLWMCGLIQRDKPENQVHNVPVIVPGIPQVQFVGVGLSHTIAVDLNGDLWSWGTNGSGELGREDDQILNTIPVPFRVNSFRSATIKSARK